ncbi:hypothetical protein ENROMA047B_24945 [Enterobacter rongchengensis]
MNQSQFQKAVSISRVMGFVALTYFWECLTGIKNAN